MASKLLIVESPGKIKKIKEYLGEEWEVKASIGHFRDLPPKELGIDKQKNFNLTYVISDEKLDVVKGLVSAAQKVGKDNVFLATDPDREGEAISFHLCHILNLNPNSKVRVTFNDITKKSIQDAIKTPRTINAKLVEAQQARRAVDRLVGYEISPVLSRKIEGDKLSAGRVQSVGLKLIVELEKSIKAFKSSNYFNLTAKFLTDKKESIKAKSSKEFQNDTEAKVLLEQIKNDIFKIKDLVTKPSNKNPKAPFSTSALQQAANKQLKIPVKKVMEIAQKLYENGHITYMRTDSVNLSDQAMDDSKNFILSEHGKEYYERRTFKNKDQNAQEAHEAIRPTHFDHKTIEGTPDEIRLYNLIYTRTIACQMKPAIIEKTTITIISDPNKVEFTSSAQIIRFDGYLKVYDDSSETTEDDKTDENESPISAINTGDLLNPEIIISKQTFPNPPKRYDESNLVEQLEKRGIGRPSTYASIINTLFIREFIVVKDNPGAKVESQILSLSFPDKKIVSTLKNETVGGDKGKLTPTSKGIVTTDFLQNYFSDIVNYDFTSEIEKELDDICTGNMTYLKCLQNIDKVLSKYIANTDSIPSTKEPKSKEIGIYNDKMIYAGTGKFGTFLLHNKLFTNVKDIAPENITLDNAISLIEENLKSDKSKTQDKTPDKVLKKIGKYQIIQNDRGTFISDGNDKCYIPKFWNNEYKDKKPEDCKKQLDWYIANVKNKKN